MRVLSGFFKDLGLRSTRRKASAAAVIALTLSIVVGPAIHNPKLQTPSCLGLGALMTIRTEDISGKINADSKRLGGRKPTILAEEPSRPRFAATSSLLVIVVPLAMLPHAQRFSGFRVKGFKGLRHSMSS